MEIYCEYCGGLQEDGAQYCPSCGARITQMAVKAAEEAKAAKEENEAAAAQIETITAETQTTTIDDVESPLETLLDTLGDMTAAGGSLLGRLFTQRKRKAPQMKPPAHSRFDALRNVVQHHQSVRPVPPRQDIAQRPGMGQRPAPEHRGPGGQGGRGPGGHGPGGFGGRGGHGGPGGPGRR